MSYRSPPLRCNFIISQKCNKCNKKYLDKLRKCVIL
nr:MAG TPA: hypothetical protein [Caudoviricetes sp.]